MKPLEPLAPTSTIAALLSSGTAEAIEAELAAIDARLGASDPRPERELELAALTYARAAFALREGRIETAREGFEEASRQFLARGEVEPEQVCRLDGATARARRGRRDAALEAEAIAAPLETEGATIEVRVRATIVRGTAFRVLGDVAHAQACFARAIVASREVPEVRSMALNSLGTLCVALGAFGAADTLCEHAAELCRVRKDTVGEAIAMGQLGAAAVGRGDLDKARKYLSRQEWLSAQIGDAFGRTRSLVWLAEAALEAGRADDAALLARRALESAHTVSPPLSTFAAYAERALGRARLAMGEARGRENIETARATFASQRLPLGEALSSRDLALAQAPVDRPQALAALGSLAGLGLPERIAEALPALGASAELELAIATASGRRLDPLEARLVYERPEVLASVAEDRSGARKNLARLAVLCLSDAGLWVAAAAVPSSESIAHLVDETQLACASIGGFAGLVLLAWPLVSSPSAVASDLERIHARASGPARFALERVEAARVTSPGFGAGLSATVEAYDPWPLAALAREAEPSTVRAAGELPDRAAFVEAFAATRLSLG